MPRAAPVLPILALALASLSCSGESARTAPGTSGGASPAAHSKTYLSVTDLTVDAACGQCQFDMPGEGCDLAVRLPENARFFVDGTAIDEHGDAHGADGFCNAVRRAVISGETVDGRLVVSSFELLPVDDEG